MQVHQRFTTLGRSTLLIPPLLTPAGLSGMGVAGAMGTPSSSRIISPSFRCQSVAPVPLLSPLPDLVSVAKSYQPRGLASVVLGSRLQSLQ